MNFSIRFASSHHLLYIYIYIKFHGTGKSLLLLLHNAMHGCALHKDTWLRKEWDLNSSPHSSLQAVRLDTGKYSSGGRIAFFPVHTEMQYGLVAAPFSLQRHVRLLTSIKVVVGSHSKRQD